MSNTIYKNANDLITKYLGRNYEMSPKETFHGLEMSTYITKDAGKKPGKLNVRTISRISGPANKVQEVFKTCVTLGKSLEKWASKQGVQNTMVEMLSELGKGAVTVVVAVKCDKLPSFDADGNAKCTGKASIHLFDEREGLPPDAQRYRKLKGTVEEQTCTLADLRALEQAVEEEFPALIERLRAM